MLWADLGVMPTKIKYPIRRPILPIFWLVTFHPYFKVKKVKLTKKMHIISLSLCQNVMIN